MEVGRERGGGEPRRRVDGTGGWRKRVVNGGSRVEERFICEAMRRLIHQSLDSVQVINWILWRRSIQRDSSLFSTTRYHPRAHRTSMLYGHPFRLPLRDHFVERWKLWTKGWIIHRSRIYWGKIRRGLSASWKKHYFEKNAALALNSLLMWMSIKHRRILTRLGRFKKRWLFWSWLFDIMNEELNSVDY